jgi:methylglyoxal synthase
MGDLHHPLNRPTPKIFHQTESHFSKLDHMEGLKKLQARKRIALIAHDNKKIDIIEWAVYNKVVLSKHELFATGTTGRLIEEALNTTVLKLLSGPLGGDQQIGSMVAEGGIDMIIFFWDPMAALCHDVDIKALLRLSVVWNIPIANNRTSADFLLTSPLMSQEYHVQLPDYTKHTGRVIE